MNQNHLIIGVVLAFAVIVVISFAMRKPKPTPENYKYNKKNSRFQNRMQNGNGRVVSPIMNDCPSCNGDNGNNVQSGYTTSYTQYKNGKRARGPIKEGFMNIYTVNTPVDTPLKFASTPPLNAPFIGPLEGALSENPYAGVDDG